MWFRSHSPKFSASRNVLLSCGCASKRPDKGGGHFSENFCKARKCSIIPSHHFVVTAWAPERVSLNRCGLYSSGSVLFSRLFYSANYKVQPPELKSSLARSRLIRVCPHKERPHSAVDDFAARAEAPPAGGRVVFQEQRLGSRKRRPATVGVVVVSPPDVFCEF